MRLWGRRGRLARYVRGYMRFGQLCNRSYVAAGGKTRRYKIEKCGKPPKQILYLRVLLPESAERATKKWSRTIKKRYAILAYL